MTVSAPDSPFVQLNYQGSLAAEDISALQISNSLNKPVDVFTDAFNAARAFVARRAAEDISSSTVVDSVLIRGAVADAWQLFLPSFTRSTLPVIAESYIGAFRDVGEGNVPAKMIFNVAEEHAKRVGEYFNDTSSDALVEGFNRLVNKQIIPKLAAQRVVEAYGLTPRQMNGFVASEVLQPKKTATSILLNPKKKIAQYIAKSFAERMKVFAEQETHNLSEQANQVAWMWLERKGRIPENTKKQWMTARDEKVCKVCGPMQGKKVGLDEQFELPNGNKLYVPGAHVNCRCHVRLTANPFVIVKRLVPISKADFDPREHPRGGDPENKGRFSRKPVSPRLKPFKEPEIGANEAAQLEEEAKLQQAEEQALLEYRLSLITDPKETRPSIADITKPTPFSAEAQRNRPSIASLQNPQTFVEMQEQKTQEKPPGLITPVGITPVSMTEVAARAAAIRPMKAILGTRDAGLGQLQKPRAEETTYTNVVPLGDTHLAPAGLDEIYYMDRDDAPKGVVRIEAVHPRTFYATNQNQDFGQVVEQEAITVYEDLVQQVKARRQGRGGTFVRDNPHYPGEPLIADVSDVDIENAIQDMAYHDDPEYTPHGMYTLKWYSPRTPTQPTIENDMSYEQLATDYLEVDPADLHINLYRVTKGHKGAVVDSDNYPHFSKDLHGDFRITDEHLLTREETEDLGIDTYLPIRIIDIEPLAKPDVVYRDIDPNEGEIVDE